MIQLQKTANILFIYVLCLVLLIAHFFQFAEHAKPCPLCLLQRLGVFGIALALLLNLRFGIQAQNYGLALLSAMMGSAVSLRQTSFHLCQQSFATLPFFGFDLYIWALIVFTCSMIALAFLMMLLGWTDHKEAPPTWGWVEKIPFALVVLLLIANIAAPLAHLY